RSVLTLLLTMIDGKKTSVFVAFGRGAERSNANALLTLSDVFSGGAVERRLLSGWSFQQRNRNVQKTRQSVVAIGNRKVSITATGFIAPSISNRQTCEQSP